MTQLDFFSETLSKKIDRVEKWVARLNKELIFLKEVVKLQQKAERQKSVSTTFVDVDFFGT